MLVFVDESGDTGMKGKAGSSEFFTVAAVVFTDLAQANSCDAHIDEIRDQLSLPPRAEFHFSKNSHSVRTTFLSEVVQFDFRYLAFVLNKKMLTSEGFQDKDSLYKFTTRLLFENVKPRLEQAAVILDKTGRNEFRSQLARYLRRHMQDEERQVIKKIKMQRSDGNNLLQLSDMVCGAVARSLTKRKHAGTYRSIIRRRESRVQVWPKS